MGRKRKYNDGEPDTRIAGLHWAMNRLDTLGLLRLKYKTKEEQDIYQTAITDSQDVIRKEMLELMHEQLWHHKIPVTNNPRSKSTNDKVKKPISNKHLAV